MEEKRSESRRNALRKETREKLGCEVGSIGPHGRSGRRVDGDGREDGRFLQRFEHRTLELRREVNFKYDDSALILMPR